MTRAEVAKINNFEDLISCLGVELLTNLLEIPVSAHKSFECFVTIGIGLRAWLLAIKARQLDMVMVSAPECCSDSLVINADICKNATCCGSPATKAVMPSCRHENSATPGIACFHGANVGSMQRTGRCGGICA